MDEMERPLEPGITATTAAKLATIGADAITPQKFGLSAHCPSDRLQRVLAYPAVAN